MSVAAALGDVAPVQRLGVGGQVGYGVGQIAGQIFRDIPSLLLLFFLTTVLGIDPRLAGAAIFVPKLVFGIGCDMAVGVLSDRWQRRVPRRWWLVAGAIGAPVAMLLLFHVPDAATEWRVAYIFVAVAFYMAVFASFSVPYLAIAGELSSDSDGRTVLMAWRLAFTAVGVLVAGAAAPAIVEAYGGKQPAYETMAAVLAVICPAALLVAFFTGTSRPLAATAAPRLRLGYRAAAAVLLRPRFAVLFGVNIVQLAGAGMGYAALLYFLAFNMGRADALQAIGGIVLAACAGIVVAQPLWVALSRRIGKRRGYVLGSVIYSASYLVWAASADAPLWVAFALSFVAAIGNSGWAMLGFSMVSDIAGDDAPHAGLYSAAWVASDKIGFALGGTLLVGLVLSGFGFDAQGAMAGRPQTELALIGVMVAFGVIPAALNLLGAGLLARWGRDA